MYKWAIGILVAAGIGWMHPFYVSVIEIQHNAKEQALETSVRIFTDDLENTLKVRFPGRKIDLYQTNAATDSLISFYIREKLQLKVDGRKVGFTYVGSERVSESTWCYLEVTGVPLVKKLQVHNQLLYEYKKEQINMHHVTVGAERKSYKLDNPVTEFALEF